LEGFEFASDPRRRFPGSHQFRRRLKYFRHESFAPALALEVRSMNGGSGFDPGEFGFQHPDAGGERLHRRLIVHRRADGAGRKGNAVVPALPQQPVYERPEG
jgi:hypothetical protein